MTDTARLIHAASHAYRSQAESDVRATARVQRVVGDDGLILPESASNVTPILILSWWLPGAAFIGSNVGAEIRLPQTSTALMIHARAKTPPSTSEYQAQVLANGVAINNDSVTISAGESSGTSVMNAEVLAGSVLTVNVIADGTASDVTISLYYRPTLS